MSHYFISNPNETTSAAIVRIHKLQHIINRDSTLKSKYTEKSLTIKPVQHKLRIVK